MLNMPMPTVLCIIEQPDVVMWVQGRATSSDHRSVIREVMANRVFWPADIRVITLFFVGVSEKPEIQSLVEYEFEMYGDIIQNDYLGECNSIIADQGKV